MDALRRLAPGFDIPSAGRWFLLSSLVGCVAGAGAIAFQFLLGAATHFCLGGVAGYFPVEAEAEPTWFHAFETPFSIWWILPLLAGGGLLSGWIVYKFAPEAEGHGTDAAIEAFHANRGKIRARIPLVKMVASAITIGTGGSGGREGPIAQIGAGFGSLLATKLKLSARERRLLLAAGMGAGVGAIFRAPLAGALFAGEIFYREGDFETEAIVPAAISSIVGYSIYSLVLPEATRFSPLFGRPHDYGFTNLLELLPLTLLAVVLVVSGVLYVKVFYGTHRLFDRLPVPKPLKPAVGATLAGLFAIWLFYGFGEDRQALAVLSAGYGAIQEAMQPGATIGFGLLIAIAFGKILTTSLTISSGGSGGVFGPSMVIGGCVGACFGGLLHQIWPDVVRQPGGYVVVGMAGFFAGIARAPFSTIVMVSEMTGDYQLLLPSMWVSTLCFLLCRRTTLYVKQVRSHLDSGAHRGDLIVDVLAEIQVAQVYRPLSEDFLTFHPAARLVDIVHDISNTRQDYFPVLSDDGRVVGIFAESDVRQYFYDEKMWEILVAGDVMSTDVLLVRPEDDLNRALRRFTEKNIDELPVVDSIDEDGRPGRLIGMLRRKETIAFYNSRLEALQSEAQEA